MEESNDGGVDVIVLLSGVSAVSFLEEVGVVVVVCDVVVVDVVVLVLDWVEERSRLAIGSAWAR